MISSLAGTESTCKAVQPHQQPLWLIQQLIETGSAVLLPRYLQRTRVHGTLRPRAAKRASARLTASARKVKQGQDQPWHRPGHASCRKTLPGPSEQLAERAAHAAAANMLDGGNGRVVQRRHVPA